MDSDSPDVEAVRAELRAGRERAVARAEGLRRDVAVHKEAAMDGGTDDEHDPEGTTAFERAQAQSLLDAALAQIGEYDVAATRLAAGTYGACEHCGSSIAPARLLARPLARRCIACASVRR